MRRSKYQTDRPSLLNLDGLLQPETKQVLLITNDKNMEQKLKKSSFVCQCHKTLNNKDIKIIIRSSTIKIGTESRDYVGDNKVL